MRGLLRRRIFGGEGVESPVVRVVDGGQEAAFCVRHCREVVFDVGGLCELRSGPDAVVRGLGKGCAGNG